MNVLGLDLSLTGTGWAGIDTGEGPILWGTFSPPKAIGELERLAWILKRVTGIATAADLIVIEGFAFGAKGNAVFQIAGLAYLVRYWLWQNKTPFVLVSPHALKKFCVGTSGSSKNPVTKELVIREVFKRWGHDAGDNNQADAIGLLYIGLALTGHYEPTIDAQRAVLADIRSNQAAALSTLEVAA